MKEFINSSDLNRYSWFQGFFVYDSTRWKRNHAELNLRDASVFSLGDINNKSVLDIGCGQGLYTLTFLKMGAAFVGSIDLSEKMVKLTRDICFENGFANFETKTESCTDLSFAENKFDCAFSGDVFEHITDEQKKKCLHEIFRVLKPGGTVTIKTPNKNYLKLSLIVKRISALLHGQNPFAIHIAHTRNNPDNEHHGLTTHAGLIKLFHESDFSEPRITYSALARKGFPIFLAKLLKYNTWFNEHIILSARKPIFSTMYENSI